MKKDSENKIKILVNQETLICKSNITIQDLLIYLNYNINLISVEYNGNIISKNQLINYTINQGDKIEIITIVGGG